MAVLEILSILWLVGTALTIVYSILITAANIINFLRGKAHLIRGKHRIGFSLQEKLKNGKYHTVYGVFDTKTEDLISGKREVSEKRDSELADYHAKEELVIYS